ncbi:MAG: 2-keto-4-pentenoate hydratase [Pseudonocardiales bacterium]|jgi:2-keto-4-pentenoate hydratase|nr:2-keto-4-pentenoate hydratase [Pseudonocardiales bacterium]
MTDTTTQPREKLVAAAAARLRDAGMRARPCQPVRDLLGRTDIALAYAVQQRLTDERLATGSRIIGRKIGDAKSAGGVAQLLPNRVRVRLPKTHDR